MATTGEDISPAVAISSPLQTDPFENDETTFIFGNSDEAESNPTSDPSQSATATATATSAPNSPASATSNVGATGGLTSAAAGGPNWLLIGAIGIVAVLFLSHHK